MLFTEIVLYAISSVPTIHVFYKATVDFLPLQSPKLSRYYGNSFSNKIRLPPGLYKKIGQIPLED